MVGVWWEMTSEAKVLTPSFLTSPPPQQAQASNLGSGTRMVLHGAWTPSERRDHEGMVRIYALRGQWAVPDVSSSTPTGHSGAVAVNMVPAPKPPWFLGGFQG